MLKRRLIPCLDIRDGQVTKGVSFKDNVDLGDPVPLVAKYYAQGADEVVIYDITASIESRPPDAATIARIASQVFVPICVGGGIRSFEDAALVIRSGAEKVSLNSVAPRNPELLREISQHFGTQAVVLSLDVARDESCPSGYRLFVQGGRQSTEWDMMAWLDHILPFGVGEVCINSIDEDGKRQGYDLALLRLARQRLDVPLIASGGAGSVAHMAEALLAGCDAALVASLLHIDGYSCDEIKKELVQMGVAMRIDAGLPV
jgi:cyclase